MWVHRPAPCVHVEGVDGVRKQLALAEPVDPRLLRVLRDGRSVVGGTVGDAAFSLLLDSAGVPQRHWSLPGIPRDLVETGSGQLALIVGSDRRPS